MPSYETEVAIEAPAHRVWAVTCDVEAWPSWSPTVDDLRLESPGPVRPGSVALVRQPRLRPARWTVLEADVDRTFVWETRGPGYRIVASHVLIPRGEACTMRLGLEVTGPLARPLWLVAGRTSRSYVNQEAAALRAHCER